MLQALVGHDIVFGIDLAILDSFIYVVFYLKREILLFINGKNRLELIQVVLFFR